MALPEYSANMGACLSVFVAYVSTAAAIVTPDLPWAKMVMVAAAVDT